ncbi:ribonuclease 3 [Litorimonas cladophorae]|uniref:Ribonuclease 3 n=1 Tax=Litorimonas cladophorae TaxID=1220491 RepID=A0A918KDA3_9PROT|nr:ribonuclease III [Litorimonas cladophorae]GGX59265.1 ribonuclease 3 [Litorimonas cladophorae]
MTAIGEGRYPRLSGLESRIGYTFENISLLVRAMTHSSYGDGQRVTPDNERLEFLGDRVLGLMTADALFHHSKDAEGTLARQLNALVRKETCAQVARQISLGDAILVSSAEDRQGGREKTSILGDACEALIAAIYLDGGYKNAKKFFDKFWQPILAEVVQKSAKDPKTELQERAMAVGQNLPKYEIIERSGPDHRPLFVIEVTVDGIGNARGTGKSKRDAERFAALHLLEGWPS